MPKAGTIVLILAAVAAGVLGWAIWRSRQVAALQAKQSSGGYKATAYDIADIVDRFSLSNKVAGWVREIF